MECITPSSDVALKPGESLTMSQLLEKVAGLESTDAPTAQQIPQTDQEEYIKLTELLGPCLSPSTPENLIMQNLDPPKKRESYFGSTSSSFYVDMDESMLPHLKPQNFDPLQKKPVNVGSVNSSMKILP